MWKCPRTVNVINVTISDYLTKKSEMQCDQSGALKIQLGFLKSVVF